MIDTWNLLLTLPEKDLISCERTDIENEMSDIYHIVCVPPSFDFSLQIENIPIIINPNCQLDIYQTGINLLNIVK